MTKYNVVNYSKFRDSKFSGFSYQTFSDSIWVHQILYFIYQFDEGIQVIIYKLHVIH